MTKIIRFCKKLLEISPRVLNKGSTYLPTYLNKNKNFQAWWIILFSVYFPILSSKDDISFRLELGSAHVKFDRLNQQSNLIVWVDLNRY